MKPFFEKVVVDQGSSWTLFDRQLETFPFEWHYHPEFELTLTLNSLGQRYIGDHIGDYEDSDLVLLGPNLPHSWCSQKKIDFDRPHRAIVLWFSKDLIRHLIEPWTEFGGIRRLLIQQSPRGVLFSPAFRRKAAERISELLNEVRLGGFSACFRCSSCWAAMKPASFSPLFPFRTLLRSSHRMEQLFTAYFHTFTSITGKRFRPWNSPRELTSA